MRIVHERPPVWEECVARFGITPEAHVVFAYGDSIYNPTGSVLTADVIHHEMVHERQQDGDPRDWWDKYLVDDDFRFEQELEAYGAQYKFIRERKNPRMAWLYLQHFADALSSSMYGNMIGKIAAAKAIDEQSRV
jgi:hypothetical protein